MSKRKSADTWTDEETYLAINLIDVCKRDGLDYESTVVTRLSHLSKSAVTMKRVLRRLYVVLRKPRPEILNAGPDCIEEDQRRGEWFKGLNASRIELDLDHLSEYRTSDTRKDTSMETGYSGPSLRSRKRPLVECQSRHTKPRHEKSSTKPCVATMSLQLDRIQDMFTNVVVPMQAKTETSDATIAELRTQQSTMQATIKASEATIADLSTQQSTMQTKLDVPAPNWLAIRTMIQSNLKQYASPDASYDGGITQTMERVLGEFQAGPVKGMVAWAKHYIELQKKLNEALASMRIVPGRDCAPHQYPKAPQIKVLRDEWLHLREGIQEMVGYESGALAHEDRGYISAKVEDLLGGCKSDEELNHWIEATAIRVHQPWSAQVVIGALTCHWLFAGPEPMLTEAYRGVLLSYYKSVALIDGVTEVQKRDLVNTKLYLEDTQISGLVVTQRVAMLAARLRETSGLICKYDTPVSQGFDIDGWAKKSVDLKQKLMFSPMAYRIRSCLPGDRYDPQWMQAENKDGSIVPEKDLSDREYTVAICLFPALMQHDIDTLPEDVDFTAALAGHKRFFSKPGESSSFETTEVISKAVVVLSTKVQKLNLRV
ncbi:hypothetical protein C7974DRAFT_412438 [Boeremia exigua]|uniref:uncharacterized protein n=1 Tax=Boeremia exigua TaxID=749465 RepID=UPI001E8DB7B0|nr:uncharacterized protein C7974DRAFT_412438 [Boeremia exigua]KAH6633445.1 hypothetical protein C7974DRAFT_412438 [Boeremia exigua]